MVKILKGSRPQAVTANRLGDGAVVFLTAGGAWSVHVADSAIAADAAAAAPLLRAAEADEKRNLVVHPYLIEVDAAGAAPVPVRYRERIRADGPGIAATTPAAAGAGEGH